MKHRDQTIDIAKGIGIILMVIGHSGCPKFLHDLIYMFHMPLFFICSGYFYKNLTTGKEVATFWRKRFKGLYLPYIKWSIVFLLLHNVFYNLNIYSNEYGYLGNTSSLYNIQDFVQRLFWILFYMNGHEGLLGGFWFLKSLLLSVLCFSLIDFFLRKWENNHFKNTAILLFLISASIITRHTNIHFSILGNLFHISYGCLFFFCGYLLHQYNIITTYSNQLITKRTITSTILFVFVSIGACLIPNEMILVSTLQTIPYFIVALIGTILTFNIAKYLTRFRIGFYLTFAGRHSMSILALHFLAFKIVSLIKIYIYDLPPKMLSCFPVIEDHNKYFWPLYTAIGVCIPLIVQWLYEKVVKVRK